MRTLLVLGLVVSAAAASGCGGGAGLPAIRDVEVATVVDHSPRSDVPRDVLSGLREAIPALAREHGLGQFGTEGVAAQVQLEVLDFPPHGQGGIGAGSTWIEAGPISVAYTVRDEKGTVLAETTITTDPRDAIAVADDPFVATQARAFVRWLLGK